MIRIFVFVMMMLPGLAMADEIARIQNKSGGDVVFTDEPCDDGGMALYSILDPDFAGTVAAHVIFGCWFMAGPDVGEVLVRWDNGDVTAMFFEDEDED